MKKSISSLQSDQQGMASIIVTLILIIIITLIVLGFATISRREQRQALDRQLSTQAFYAAESGINDAVSAINSGSFTQIGHYPSGQKKSCDDPAGIFTGSVNSSVGASYTCLLIDTTPPEAQYQITNGKAVSADLHFGGASPVNAAAQLIIDWTSDGNAKANTPDGAPNFNLPDSGTWNGSALLQVQLTDLNNGYSRSALNNSTFTTYLYPSNSISSIPFKTTGSLNGLLAQGHIYKAGCSGGKCEAIITFSPAATHLFLHIGAMYENADVTIRALDSSGGSMNFLGVQATIDSTGKAQDVLRRVQVHLPLQKQSDSSIYAVQSANGICKQLQVGSGVPGGDTNGCTYP